MPGFQDAHVHPVWAGVDLLRCDLSELSTAADYLARIAAYAAARPGTGWILGSGWSMPAFPGGTPTAEALDSVVGDRPAFLPNRDGHGAWVSSAALRLAGVDRTTADPPDGRIERDRDGNPSGTLHEGAMSLVQRLLPLPSDQELYDGLLLAQARLHSVGVTAWQDAIIGDTGDGGDAGPAYLRALAQGTLRPGWSAPCGGTAPRAGADPDLLERRDQLMTERFRPTTVKIMQDGVAENFTAAMTDAYCDRHGHPTGNSGLSFVPADVLLQAAARLTPPASSCTSTRSATAPCASASTRSSMPCG
ncbi:MAG: amidohydrolase family protein [Nocardioides sp.]